MTVSSTQPRSWTTPGARGVAACTHASVQAALHGSRHLAGLDYEVFLQGSHANDTNIRGDSDVDIVVMLKTTFMPQTELAHGRRVVLPVAPAR